MKDAGIWTSGLDDDTMILCIAIATEFSSLHESNGAKEPMAPNDHKSNILGSVYTVSKELLDQFIADELIEFLV